MNVDIEMIDAVRVYSSTVAAARTRCARAMFI